MSTFPEEWVGAWRLVARAEVKAELRPDGSEGYFRTDRWLQGDGPNPTNAVEPAGGLTLFISPEGKVTEEAGPEAVFEWFDVDGVLEAKAVPYDGTLLAHDDTPQAVAIRFVLKTEDSPPGHSRYDDGDTVITDFFSLSGAHQLLRTVSVSTDECYGDRHLYLYERQA